MGGCFVSVGNGIQPFSRLLDAIPGVAAVLPRPVVVQHGHTSFAMPGCTAYAFMEMEQFAAALAAAGLVIMHAGAGSIIHAIQARKIPVVMPRRVKYGEIIDDHQLELARALAEAGRIVLAPEPADLKAAIASVIELQSTVRPAQSVPRLVGVIAELLAEHAARIRR